MSGSYDREGELKRRLNDFLSSQFSLDEKDYYSNLDESGFLKLKVIVNLTHVIKLASIMGWDGNRQQFQHYGLVQYLQEDSC